MSKIRQKPYGYLHIGAAAPLWDFNQIMKRNPRKRKGRYTMIGIGLRRRLRPEELPKYKSALDQVEIIESKAHKALDRLIDESRKFRTIRIDMPETGIIDIGAGFDSLCKKMNSLLVENGKVVVLTDLVPDTDQNQLYLGNKGGIRRYTHSATISDIRVIQKMAASRGMPIEHKYYLVIATKII